MIWLQFISNFKFKKKNLHFHILRYNEERMINSITIIIIIITKRRQEEENYNVY
jgi:hypothetical protein